MKKIILAISILYLFNNNILYAQGSAARAVKKVLNFYPDRQDGKRMGEILGENQEAQKGFIRLTNRARKGHRAGISGEERVIRNLKSFYKDALKLHDNKAAAENALETFLEDFNFIHQFIRNNPNKFTGVPSDELRKLAKEFAQNYKGNGKGAVAHIKALRKQIDDNRTPISIEPRFLDEPHLKGRDLKDGGNCTYIEVKNYIRFYTTNLLKQTRSHFNRDIRNNGKPNPLEFWFQNLEISEKQQSKLRMAAIRVIKRNGINKIDGIKVENWVEHYIKFENLLKY